MRLLLLFTLGICDIPCIYSVMGCWKCADPGTSCGYWSYPDAQLYSANGTCHTDTTLCQWCPTVGVRYKQLPTPSVNLPLPTKLNINSLFQTLAGDKLWGQHEKEDHIDVLELDTPTGEWKSIRTYTDKNSLDVWRVPVSATNSVILTRYPDSKASTPYLCMVTAAPPPNPALDKDCIKTLLTTVNAVRVGIGVFKGSTFAFVTNSHRQAEYYFVYVYLYDTNTGWSQPQQLKSMLDWGKIIQYNSTTLYVFGKQEGILRVTLTTANHFVITDKVEYNWAYCDAILSAQSGVSCQPIVQNGVIIYCPTPQKFMGPHESLPFLYICIFDPRGALINPQGRMVLDIKHNITEQTALGMVYPSQAGTNSFYFQSSIVNSGSPNPPTSTLYHITSSVCKHGGTINNLWMCSCVDGFWGVECEHTCPPHCMKYNNFCDFQRGCICFSNFTGDDCSECKSGLGPLPKYAGCSPFDPCSMTCSGLDCEKLVCSGHGTCGSSAECACTHNAFQGHWAGPDCAMCAPGWVGPNCTVPAGEVPQLPPPTTTLPSPPNVPSSPEDTKHLHIALYNFVPSERTAAIRCYRDGEEDRVFNNLAYPDRHYLSLKFTPTDIPTCTVHLWNVTNEPFARIFRPEDWQALGALSKPNNQVAIVIYPAPGYTATCDLTKQDDCQKAGPQARGCRWNQNHNACELNCKLRGKSVALCETDMLCWFNNVTNECVVPPFVDNNLVWARSVKQAYLVDVPHNRDYIKLHIASLLPDLPVSRDLDSNDYGLVVYNVQLTLSGINPVPVGPSAPAAPSVVPSTPSVIPSTPSVIPSTPTPPLPTPSIPSGPPPPPPPPSTAPSQQGPSAPSSPSTSMSWYSTQQQAYFSVHRFIYKQFTVAADDSTVYATDSFGPHSDSVVGVDVTPIMVVHESQAQYQYTLSTCKVTPQNKCEEPSQFTEILNAQLFGSDTKTGSSVLMVAYGRRACADDSIFCSQVTVFEDATPPTPPPPPPDTTYEWLIVLCGCVGALAIIAVIVGYMYKNRSDDDDTTPLLA